MKIEGSSVTTPKAFVESIRSHASDADGLQIEVSRAGVPLSFTIVPRDGKIGSYVSYSDIKPREGFEYRYPFGQAVVVAAKETVNQTAFTFELLFELVRKLIAPKTSTERQEAAE